LIPKQEALVKMTDDEAACIEAKGWKASVVPGPSISRCRSRLRHLFAGGVVHDLRCSRHYA
jgi:hypothetical protein